MRFSLQLLPEQPIDELLDVIALADTLGFHGCYGADEIYHKDMWLLLVAAATLDELSRGRAEIVYGIGNLEMLDQYGIPWQGTRPLARLREAHAVMRAVLDEGSVDFAGDFYRYSGVFTNARPVQEWLPIKIGAMGGPRSMELAGEIADGMFTACAYAPEASRYAIEHTRQGAQRSGRDPGTRDIADNVLGAIGPDGPAARRRPRTSRTSPPKSASSTTRCSRRSAEAGSSAPARPACDADRSRGASRERPGPRRPKPTILGRAVAWANQARPQGMKVTFTGSVNVCAFVSSWPFLKSSTAVPRAPE